MWKKLKGRKERSLSQAGREVLIKVVVQAIPNYIMGCFQLPDLIFNQIESMIVKFFWSGFAENKKMHWVSWGKLARLKKKKDGDLGFKMAHNSF